MNSQRLFSLTELGSEASSPRLFSLTDRLPTGSVAIEASAGTGKTYALAGLVVRYVAEAAIPVEELLIVTFTRAAAAELRDRVRTRLTQAVRALHDPSAIEGDDELLAFVAANDGAKRLDRLERAVIDFDAATITTIHGFAQQVLATLGSAAPGDLDASLLEDTVELVEAVCADVLATESVARPFVADQLPTVEALSKLSAKVLSNPGIHVIPRVDSAGSTPVGVRLRRLVDSTVDEVHRRRRVAGTLSFDDLLTQLRDALGEGSTAVAALSRRFRVALIDEFQDTDPVQWEIFARLFGGSSARSPLVLVADPKQAIYAFRGANVHTYLEAAQQPGMTRFTLGVNRRSDGALIAGLGCLFKGVTFGDPRIKFVPVKPAPERQELRLTTDDGTVLPALGVRLAIGDDLPRNTGGAVPAAAAEAAIARDLALQLQQLLEKAWIPSPGDVPRRRVRPGSIAVLVGTNAEAERFQAALGRQAIPAVVTRSDSVLRSAAATQWRWLLTALARPADPSRARMAALSWFFGWSAAELDQSDDTQLSGVQDQLFRWAETLEVQGTVAFCAKVWSDSGAAARVLATADGDRDYTDLDHIAGLLQMRTAGRRLTATGLLALLKQLEAEAGGDPEIDITARQVESDAEAVRIMTVHAAKGLEFPIVCVPTLWRNSLAVAHEIVFQDPDTGVRTFDIANSEGWPTVSDAKARKALANDEARGESLRLLYVALTRAQHSTQLWWSRVKGSEITGLAHMLFARSDGEIDPELFATPRVGLPADQQSVAALERAFSEAGDAVAVTVAEPLERTVPPWVDSERRVGTGVLELAQFERVLVRANRRWSFSTICAKARNSELDPEDETLGDSGAADEPAEVMDNVATYDSAISSDLPLGAVPGGARFGTLIHEVLERVDFVTADLDAELRAHIDDRLRWNSWPVDVQTLVTGLRAAIESPLGRLFDGRRLRDLARSDRLGELSFELHLKSAGRPATDCDIGRLMLDHLAAEDPLRPWAKRLASGLFAVELAGHLTGSIDMVVRVPDSRDQGAPTRFVVIDYKTNALGEPGREPQGHDYHPDRLPAAMAEHHYPLQAMLYMVALHRYLRWRVPGYSPAQHLGGAAYLFVRGMTGAATPVVDGKPHGVFSWHVPPALVTELSDLLGGAEVAT